MCAAVCPKEAITIRLNKEGFYRPSVEEDSCVDCGLCVKVCYKFDKAIQVTESAELDDMPLYAASSREDALLQQTTSGGIADLLAKELVADGYTCIGVGYDDGKAIAYDYCAHTKEETDGFRGSKYIQSYTLPAFKELVNKCRTEKFAVFGTPCHIYAVNRFLEMRNLRDKCVLVDVFCHGCPSLHAWRKYQDEVKKLIGKPRFDRVDFRSKVKGWGNFYVVVVEGIRTFISSPKKDEFYELFFSDLILNEACADCALRSTMAYTDIRLGDFWGKHYALNRKGMSAVVLATKRGRFIFNRIQSQISCEECAYSEMLPYQSYGRNYTPNKELRKRLLQLLGETDVALSQVVGIYHKHQSLPGRMKRYVKHVLYYLPVSVTMMIKRYL